MHEVAFVKRPEPPVTPETEQWWAATRERRLCVQRCQRCQQDQLYPRTICTTCGSEDLALAEVSGAGHIYTYTMVHRPPDPTRFAAPYVVALVRLAEGPQLLTNLIGIDPATGEDLCDRNVALEWEALPDGRHLPLFKLT